ncbi:MAG TPA: GGDEF domain-containing phosphodiesterase [Acidobacteriota bacterium]|nr:GGDEF domain-containing phosphodiesterase [Acidobacteriota bacterium]
MPGNPRPDYFHLRAEWLKFKSNLFDKNTNLPTLAMILEDARRLTEEHETIGLFLLDLGKQRNFETTYGWQVYDSIIQQIAEILNETKKEILQESDIIAISQVRGDEFILLLNPPGGKIWDQNSVDLMNQRLRNSIRKKMERFKRQRWHSNLSIHIGYALVSRDPMIRFERTIQRAITEAREVSGQEIENELIRYHIALQRMISMNSILTFFQPIVYLDSLQVLGYEALSRGPEDSGFEGTELLFTFAESTNMLLELERLCRKNALRAAQDQHLKRYLFLNSSARSFEDSHFTPGQLSEYVHELGLQHDRIVLEITERIAILEWDKFKKVLREFRDYGFRIAIDDMGAGYSSLQAIAELEPDFLKFDISLVRNIHENLIKIGLIETLVALSAKIGAQVIAEGVEDRKEFEALRQLGVELGQGYYFAMPSPDFPRVNTPVS